MHHIILKYWQNFKRWHMVEMFVYILCSSCFYSATIVRRNRIIQQSNFIQELCVTFCFFSTLFISGSPSPSISVCHVSSVGSRGGRLLLHAWVWEEDSTPLPFAHTHMNDSPRFVFVWKTLTQWHKFVPDSKLGGSGPFPTHHKKTVGVCALRATLCARARARRWSS